MLHCWSILLLILVILRLFIVDLWAIGHECMSVGYRSIGYSSKYCLDRQSCQITVFFGDKILDLESDVRKLDSVTMLQSLIRILEY